MTENVTNYSKKLRLIDPPIDRTCIEYTNGGLLKNSITQQLQKNHSPEEQGRTASSKR